MVLFIISVIIWGAIVCSVMCCFLNMTYEEF